MRAAMKRLKNGEDAAERKNLKIEILAERLTDNIVEKYITAAMQWGIDQEVNAKAAYYGECGWNSFLYAKCRLCWNG
jgi:hypothetical protein